MGRLFWKIFFFIWLGQLTTILGVSVVWISHHNNQQQNGIDNSPPAIFLVGAAAATLQYGGPEALRNLLQSTERNAIYAVDEVGNEILGRTVSPAAISKVRMLLKNDATNPVVRQVPFSGNTYLLFLPVQESLPVPQIAGNVSSQAAQNTIFPHPREAGRLPPGRQPRRLFPFFQIVIATIASFIFASLLAWYFSKPIRHLRTAFESVAKGKFDVNLNAIMRGRRDDLADLGRDFDRMTGQLRAVIEGQRRLLHDISHELRSPLARLQVAIGLARQNPEKIESSMVRIERESIRMDKLVGELLTLSKLDAGVADSMKETISPGELLADIVEDAQFEARANGKEVELVGEARVPIQGNAELLHRAIENVIRNAIKYTAEGTAVKVEAKVDSSQLKIFILDTGSGVAETELQLIFEPFFRSNSPGNNADGHGLGLAIARRVIEAHGGKISASNRASGGLCVEMTIPLAIVKNSASEKIA